MYIVKRKTHLDFLIKKRATKKEWQASGCHVSIILISQTARRLFVNDFLVCCVNNSQMESVSIFLIFLAN